MKAEGILGMSPNSNGLFIDNLYQNNQIRENIYAFLIGHATEESQVMIGGYNTTESVREGSQMVWHNIISKGLWTLPMEQPALGQTQIKTNAKKVVVDTGSSYMVLPNSDYQQIAQIIY